jgi:hypothetical protein
MSMRSSKEPKIFIKLMTFGTIFFDDKLFFNPHIIPIKEYFRESKV